MRAEYWSSRCSLSEMMLSSRLHSLGGWLGSSSMVSERIASLLKRRAEVSEDVGVERTL